MGWIIIIILTVLVFIGSLRKKEFSDTYKHAEYLYASVREKKIKEIEEKGKGKKASKEAREFIEELDKIHSFVKDMKEYPYEHEDIDVGELVKDWENYLNAVFWIITEYNFMDTESPERLTWWESIAEEKRIKLLRLIEHGY